MYIQKTKTITVNIYKIFKTPDEIENGLMWTHVPNNVGALFVMPSCTIHSFWMKNTIVSLDMIFLNENMQVVGYIEQAIPFDLSPHTIHKPSCYVIEAKHGFIQKKNIQTGDFIQIRPV
jgi:uncharacterized membrane protein (UPF0127 family)